MSERKRKETEVVRVDAAALVVVSRGARVGSVGSSALAPCAGKLSALLQKSVVQQSMT